MKNIILTLIAAFFVTTTFSQEKNTFYYGGISISTPAYFPGLSANKAIGIGMEFHREHFFAKKFSWVAGAGYNHFTGDYSYFDFTRSGKDTTIHGFSNIPVLTGIHFYLSKEVYIGAEMGIAISAGKNLGTGFLASPSVGYKVSMGEKNNIDFGIRLMNVLQLPSTPESNSLTRGGYGIWSFKIAYGF